MKDDVTVNYSKYGENPIVRDIEFELVKDISLKLAHDKEHECVTITMKDEILENTEIDGSLSYDKLDVLIKALTQLRKSIKEDSKCGRA